LLKRKNIPQDEVQEMLRTRKFNIFVDNEFARWCSDHNCQWNDSNFFMSDDVTTLSNCCRLLSDTSKLKGFINSIGGTALSIGSIKVNTINLMHIVYELEDELSEAEYLKILRKRTKLCCKVLDRVRHIISRNIEKGLLPNYCDGGIEIDKQYCTVGILGLYEVMVKFGYIETDEFGNKSYTDKGIKFADKIFKVLNDVKDNFTDEYSFNIESVPAERAAVILCGKDSTYFNVNDFEIYSNQWIPLTAKCTINEKVRTAAILDNKCSGGAIAHINLESNFPTTDEAWNMLNYIATQGVIYFCFNTRINVCKHRHAFVGTDICPVCGEPVFDTYQRVVGFLTPSRAYSKPRKKEFGAREWYETALIKAQASLIGD
jgi:ribonucleoside-triphosphate reductase